MNEEYAAKLPVTPEYLVCKEWAFCLFCFWKSWLLNWGKPVAVRYLGCVLVELERYTLSHCCGNEIRYEQHLTMVIMKPTYWLQVQHLPKSKGILAFSLLAPSRPASGSSIQSTHWYKNTSCHNLCTYLVRIWCRFWPLIFIKMDDTSPHLLFAQKWSQNIQDTSAAILCWWLTCQFTRKGVGLGSHRLSLWSSGLLQIHHNHYLPHSNDIET